MAPQRAWCSHYLPAGVAGMRRCWRLSGEIVGLDDEAPFDTFARLGLVMVSENPE